MKYLKIPSVVEFHFKDKEVDLLAQELFNIVKNKENRFEPDSKIENVNESCEYLNYQFDRLRRYAEKGESEKFDFLARILLKRSRSFLVYALNHVYPNWTSMTFTKVMKILTRVRKLTETESNEFKYKRVWIDKKEGDYGRPLGVPYAEYRIHGHMMTRIMESYLFGTKQYTNNQHGGRPFRGTLTYVREMAKRFLKANRIYEFDLKGYFDHISHKSIVDLFDSKLITNYLKGVLGAKPDGYKLPPEDKDVALKNYKNIMKVADEVLYPWRNSEHYELYKEDLVASWMREDPREFIGKYEIPENTRLELVYKELMEERLHYPVRSTKFPYGVVKYEHPDEMERARGRDSWKDLDLTEQGVPQGSSFGPVLASVLLGKIMPKDSLIYMDDGIVFLRENDRRKDADLNDMINRKVNRIGCEVNKEKSRILNCQDLMTKGLKIIGTRWMRTRGIWNETSFKVSTETRKGIQKLLFNPSRVEYEAILAEFLNNKIITPSKRRLLGWYIKNGKLERIINSELFDVASRIKVLGNILTKAYSPNCTLEEMKAEIELGIFNAELKVKASRGSLGERILNGMKSIILETTEGRREIKPSIYNLRAIASNVLLNYLKGELPVRSLKVQGLRKPVKFISTEWRERVRASKEAKESKTSTIE